MANGWVQLVKDLQSNPSLIAKFIVNPKSVVCEYDLSTEEAAALLSGNINDITALGVSNDLAAGVLSTTHTPTCGNGNLTGM